MPDGRPTAQLAAPGLALAAALSLAACGGGGSGPDLPQNPATTCPIPASPASPTFSGHILPMLRASCGAESTISCHGPQPRVGKVSYSATRTPMEVWGDLVGAVPANAPTGQGWLRVAAGDPARSWILEKVTSDNPGAGATFGAYGARMPYAAPNLCDATVQALRAWILAGAMND